MISEELMSVETEAIITPLIMKGIATGSPVIDERRSSLVDTHTPLLPWPPAECVAYCSDGDGSFTMRSGLGGCHLLKSIIALF